MNEDTAAGVFDVVAQGEISELGNIYERHAQYFELAEKLLVLAYDCVPLGKTIEHQLPARVERILMVLYVQVFRLYRSILVLCKCGLDSEALILLRSLLETTSMLLYLAERDHNERIGRYYHSYRISRYSGLKDLLEAFPEVSTKLRPETPERQKKDCEESVQYFCTKHNLGSDVPDREIRRKHTIRPDIAAQEVDMPELRKMWKILYPILSEVSHAQKISEFVKQGDAANKFELQVHPRDDSTDACLINAMRLAFWSMSRINTTLRLGNGEPISALDKSVDGFFTAELV